MTKLPDGRKPLPDEWFIDRAKKMQPDNEWPQVDDFSDIRPMTNEERQRAKEKEKANTAWRKCVSCGGPAQSDFCGFCIEEE